MKVTDAAESINDEPIWISIHRPTFSAFAFARRVSIFRVSATGCKGPAEKIFRCLPTYLLNGFQARP